MTEQITEQNILGTDESIAGAEAKTPRNFRNSTEIETFYRFIHDNGLRREAKQMMEAVYNHINGLKNGKKKRKKKEVQ
jgi:hypothetical protein